MSITVLHTESSLGWGGQENRTLYECLGLRRLGARVIILCKPESKLRQRAEKAGFDVRAHRMKSNRDLAAVRFILNLIKSDSVDVICTHSGDDSFLSAIAGRLSRRKPIIVRTRHLALPITSKMTYSLFPHKVVTVSEFVRRYLVDDKGIDKEKVVTVPTGVDIERFSPDAAADTLRKELNLPDKALIVGTVAILRKKKGHEFLLDAASGILKEVPNAVFVFAGDGPQRENLEAKIRTLGITDKVIFLGLRPDVPTVLKGLDIFVLPTLQEALGTSILEASAMRKAVVATSVGGVPEAVIDGVTGILVPPSDPRALEVAIVRLLKDAAMRKKMGEAGRIMVEKEYTTDKMAEGMFALYKGLLKKRNG